MNSNENIIIDYEEIFDDNNNKQNKFLDNGDLEKKSTITLTLYFLLFFIGFGLIIGQFVAGSFYEPYNDAATNEFMLNEIIENKDLLVLIESNEEITLDSEEILLIGTYTYLETDYSLFTNVINIDYVDWLTTGEEIVDASILSEILNGNITNWDNDSLNNRFKLYFSVNSNIYDELMVTEDTILPETLNAFLVSDTNYNNVINFVVYILIGIPVTLMFRKEIIHDFVIIKKERGSILEKILVGFSFMLLVNLGSGVITMVLKSLAGISGDSVNQASIINALNSNTTILMVVSAVILAPIVEELVFRKSIFTLIKNPKIAILASALLFSLPHVLSEPDIISFIINIIPYLSMGVFFGYYYYYKTDQNIAILISIHAANNLFSVISILI